jgi:uncharacterized delta-60 repeat protein
MFFTPFAFIQQPYAVTVIPSILQGYYIMGNFNGYATGNDQFIRVLDSSGSISSSFNVGSGTNSTVNCAASQSDGKILLGGGFGAYSGSSSRSVVRVNTNGTRDTSFNIGTTGFNNAVYSIAVQADQKILVGGLFTTYSGSAKNYIARINTNGTADTGSSWNTGIGANSNVYSVAIQSDQKIIAGGGFTTYSGSAKSRIVRLNVDGTADTGSSWNQGVGFGNVVYSVAVQADQKIIAGGFFTTYSGSAKNYIARLNTDGTADTGSSWNQGVGANDQVISIAVQADQKILVGGLFTTYSGSTANRIVRINTDGTADTSFNIGTGFDSSVYSIALQADQKIVVQGTFSNYSGSVVLGAARLNTDGTLDTTFNRNFSINQSSIPAATLPLANGSIIIGGSFTGNRVGYATFLNSSGSNTSSSSIALNGFTTTVTTAASQLDRKVVMGGDFTFYSGSTKNRIVRFNTDGTIDTGSSWNQGAGFSGGNVQSIAIQADQKIIAVGGFTTYSGSARNYIARLNTNGTIDPTSSFNIGTGFNGGTVSSVIQTDQKILVVGGFTSYSGSSNSYLVRINTNGTKDTSFNVGGFNQSATSIAIQADQKVIVGGVFTIYAGSTKNYIARLNTDGTADTGSSWNQGAGADGQVQVIAVQADQKILVGGILTSYSGSTKNRIARLNTDGTADTGSSWNQGNGFGGTVRAIVVQSDGKIVVGGDFTSYSGSTANRIVRINTDGTRDTTFIPTGSGFNTTVRYILPIYD